MYLAGHLPGAVVPQEVLFEEVGELQGPLVFLPTSDFLHKELWMKYLGSPAACG